MCEFLLHLLAGAHGTLAYSLVFGFLVACGLGLPLPEDVALVTGGYLTFIGAANLWLMLLFALCGILLGDLLVYSAGHRYGQKLAHTHWLHRYLTDEKLARVEGYFKRYGQGLVVAARFLPGLRVVTYFSAGTAEMGVGRFLLFDALAASVSAPLWVFIGRRLGKRLSRAMVWVSRFHWVLVGVAVVILLAVLVLILRRNGTGQGRPVRNGANGKRPVTSGRAVTPPPAETPATAGEERAEDEQGLSRLAAPE